MLTLGVDRDNEKLVGWDITSISVNPDVINETRQVIYEAEEELVIKR